MRLRSFRQQPPYPAGQYALRYRDPFNFEDHTVSLCQFLPSPVSLDFTHDFLTSEDGRLSTLESGTRMSRLLKPFFDSNVLTTLRFTGCTFPLGLLKSTPNLIHLSLFKVENCPSLSPEDASAPTLNLPFRLKSACFSNSFSAASHIISINAQVFSELEVLALFPAAPLNDDCPWPFVQLLSLVSRTLKDLRIRKSGMERKRCVSVLIPMD